MTKLAKTKYRIRNWAEYNRALINRESLTVWFEDFPEKWALVTESSYPTIYPFKRKINS